jgi:hypothetical protein
MAVKFSRQNGGRKLMKEAHRFEAYDKILELRTSEHGPPKLQ